MPRRLPMILPAALAALAAAAPPAAAAPSTTAVLSEFQFRGPISGNDEFVELRNVSGAALPVGGWRLQGCNTAGSIGDRATIPAGRTIPAGGTFLFANTGTGGTVANGDVTYTTGFGDTGGARLVTAAGAIVDQVGATGAQPCKEGTGLALPTSGSATAFERVGGIQDTDDNAADFTGPKAGTPQPCGTACTGNPDPDPEPEVTPIHAIQGAGARSPKTGETVTIEGVVTGWDDEIGSNFERTFPADAGLFVQEEPADADGDPATSDGIYVGFVRRRTAYPPGTVVRITGKVVENFQETRIEEAFDTEPVAIGTALVPAPVTIDPTRAAAQSATTRDYYESLEGMNVRLEVGTATAGGRTKFGEVFLQPGVRQAPEDRLFRTEAAPDQIAADSDAGAGDPSNPLVDTDSTTELDADLFDVVRGLEGPVGFAFGSYRILNQPGTRPQPTVEDGPIPYPLPEIGQRADDELRVASYNVENFFPVGGDVDRRKVTAEEYEEKLARVADAIGDLLERPDVVALQEVVDQGVADDIAARLGGYTAFLAEGNDERGIDVAFLVRDTVTATDFRQLGKDATTTVSGCADSDAGALLFDRPPIAIDVERRGVAFTVINNHFASKGNPDACREAQATFVRDRVAEIEAAGGEAMVVGDLNSFEDEIALQVLEGPGTSLDNLWDQAPEQERYSFQFQGRLQTLDHALVTDGLAPRVEDVRYVHLNNDYADRRDPQDGHRSSDHDPILVTLDLPGVPVATAPPAVRRAPGDRPDKPIKAKDVLAAERGTWTVDEGELTYAYQWLRCSGTSEAGCAPIDGATEATYTVDKDDRDARLRVRVTATAPGGSTTAVSAPTTPVK